MEGFFIFDMTNDLVFRFSNNDMNDKLLEIAKKNGFISSEEKTHQALTSDVLMQVFNPLLANLRFMLIQFDNSFNYVKCKHGFNMVFDDQNFGFLLITISSTKTIEFMQRSQAMYKEFLRHLLGPLTDQLKNDTKTLELLTKLIISWNKLYLTNQDVCVEAIEQLVINNDVKKNNLVATLELALEKLKQDPQLQRSHAILFYENKFLSMFSARTSQELIPSDIFFLNLFNQSIEMSSKIEGNLLFMRGSNNSCIPYKVNRIAISSEIRLILLSEYGNTIISSNLYETFILLNKIKILQAQSDLESLVIETEKLDKNVKHVIDVEKKIKHNNHELEECAKNFQSRYENLRKKFTEMLKIMDKSKLVKVESYFPCFMEIAKDLYRLTYFNAASRKINADQEKIFTNVSNLVTDKLMKFAEFFEVKAKSNFVMSQYLEDFAGMVHFIFVDRQRGFCIFPNIDITVRETSPQIKKKVWDTIVSGRNYLQNGQTTVLWKDTAFSYLYLLWFEDANGQVLKPKDQINTTTATGKHCLQPGVMSYGFYQKLIEAFFPKMTNGINKIKVYELFTIHLGLATPVLQLEHSRRLIATISDEMSANLDEANGNKINPTMDLKTTSSKINEDDSASISEYTDPDQNNSAPTELLAEFLTSIMRREWKIALKHCKMILEYEPNNVTAKDFYPQLMQRVNEHQSSTSSDENCNYTSSLDNVDNEILDNEMVDDSSSITSSNSTSNGSMDLNSFSEEELGEEMQEEQDQEDLINASISCDSSDTFPESMSSSSESINRRGTYSPSLSSLLLDDNMADDINNNEPTVDHSSENPQPPSNPSPFMSSKLVNMIRRKLH